MAWQKRIPDCFPKAIVTVASDADVIEAVKLARSRGLRTSVRADGHSWIATSLRDGRM
jgi:FAD/FMN-containing dehydrogenase